MKILLLNQTFYPDVVATAQHLYELALHLAEARHQVTVVSSSRAYDNPAVRFPSREQHRGICIRRIPATGFGKQAKWRRVADFGSFMAACTLRLMTLPRHDVVVTLTSPPLISLLGALWAQARRGRFVYWIMDLNPDEAIAAGWLRPHSAPARLLEGISRYCLRRADRIVVLDRFMQQRILAKGIAPEKIAVLPPWADDRSLAFDPDGRHAFREQHGLNGKFVVMYSGNHSPCHPLDTLLEAALRLRQDDAFRFVFVGGGSEFKRVQAFAQQHSLGNILCLPYQPREALAQSLSAADVQTVVMGEPFVGIVHPCKIYNLLRIGLPILYIGPEQSHVTALLDMVGTVETFISVRHGQVDELVQRLKRLRDRPVSGGHPAFVDLAARFSRSRILPVLATQLEPHAPSVIWDDAAGAPPPSLHSRAA